MTHPAALPFLLEGRDYDWCFSTQVGFHSFCYLSSGPLDGIRVAAIGCQDERPGGSGWLLHWGPGTALPASPAWQPQAHRYVLDAKDAARRQLQRYVHEHYSQLLELLQPQL